MPDRPDSPREDARPQPREPVPRISSLVGVQGALRARDVSRPRPEQLAAAADLQLRRAGRHDGDDPARP